GGAQSGGRLQGQRLYGGSRHGQAGPAVRLQGRRSGRELTPCGSRMAVRIGFSLQGRGALADREAITTPYPHSITDAFPLAPDEPWLAPTSPPTASTSCSTSRSARCPRCSSCWNA